MANNETTTKFKVDISELKKGMQEAKRQVGVANSEFKAAASTMDDWSKSSEGISAKLKQLNSNLNSQKSILSNYEKQLELTMQQYPEGGKAVDDLIIKINNQKAVVNNVEREIKKYSDSLEEVAKAEKIAAETGKDVADVLADVGDEAEDAGDGFTVLKGAVAEFVGNALTQLVDGLKEGISSLVSFSDEANKAMNSFQASTGATAEDMAEFEGVMKNIYKSNYGESFEDIADSMAEIKRQSGDIGADELEKMTTNAIMLRDTFDFEVSESMRAAKMLMDQYGLSGEDAYNLIAQGAQNGLNKNGDLLDVINEYAGHFKGLGYTSEQFFNALGNGTDAGTFSVDKLGDAMKEFGIRVRDGSDTTAEAFEILGYDAEEMFKSIEDGSFFAEGMVGALIDELGGMPDSIEKTTAGVGLFGTMWEDLGAEGIRALGDLNGNISLTQDALGEINAVKYDSVGEAMTGIGRNLQTSILMPLGDKLLPIIGDLATKFQEWLNDPVTQEGIQTFTDSVAEFVDNGLAAIKEGVEWFLANKDTVIAGLAGIAAGFLAFKVVTLIQGVQKAMQGMTLAQYALNLAMSLNPIGIIVALIAGLVVAFVTLWNKSESFRNFWLGLWENVKSACGKAIEGIGKFFTETLPNFFTGLLTWVQENWKSLLTFLVNPFAGLFKYFYDNNGKFKEFVDNAIKYIKELPSKVQTWLTNTINKVTTWRSQMIEKAKEAALNFITKVVEYVKQLPSKVWTWLVNVVSKVSQWKTNLGNKAREAGQELLDKLVTKIKEIPDKVKSIGGDIVAGLWNGISDKFSWLTDKISGFASNVTDSLKDFFGIHSPSKVMADEIGKWLPEGIAVGISKNAKSTLKAMKDLTMDTVGSARAGLKTSSISMTGSSPIAGGVVNNFYQTINSPKQLSRLDIYRQSKNLLGYAGGGM